MKKKINTKEFPILMSGSAEPKHTVPWGIFDNHIEQVIRNHGQSLEELAARGGLSYEEIYFILHDSVFTKPAPSKQEAICFVTNAVKKYNKEVCRPTENIDGWDIKDVLQTVLSPDKVHEYSIEGLSDYLVENNIVKNHDDVKLIIIEALQRAMFSDDEFPVHYYTKNEPMSEEGRTTSALVLTDEYIEKMKTGR